MKLHEMVLEGKEGGSMARGEAQFAKDRAQVSIDGARADDQGFSHLGIAEAACHQPQHLHLSFGQVVGIGWRWALVLVRPGPRTSAGGNQEMCLLCNGLLWRHRPPLGHGESPGLLSK